MGRGLGKKSAAKRVFQDVLNGKRSWNSPQERQALMQLARQQYVALRKKGQDLFVELTEKGSQEALKKTIVEKKADLPRGTYCYVSFDIPEDVRHLRDAMRLLLKDARFNMVHQSLWYTRRDVADELAQLISNLKAEKFVNVFVGKQKTPLAKRAQS